VKLLVLRPTNDLNNTLPILEHCNLQIALCRKGFPLKSEAPPSSNYDKLHLGHDTIDTCIINVLYSGQEVKDETSWKPRTIGESQEASYGVVRARIPAGRDCTEVAG
jgi:hypothetical protein